MKEWFDDLDPYVDEEETEGYNPFKFNPYEEETPNRINYRAQEKEDK